MREAAQEARDSLSVERQASEALARAVSRKRPELTCHQFLQDVWDTIVPDHPFVDSWHVRCLCDHVEACLAGYDDPVTGERRDDIDRLVINLPPGLSKSVIFSVVSPCWAWTFRPTYKFLFLSFSDELATEFSELRRSVLMSDYYSARWPMAGEISRFSDVAKVVGRRAKDTSHQTRNVAGGEMRTTTVGGKVTGFHPNVVVFDDPIQPPDGEKMLRADPRELRDFRQWYRSKFVTRGYADDLRRKVMMVGQRCCLGDPTDVILQEAGPEDPRTEHICLPMEFHPDHPVRDPKRPTRLGFKDPRREPGELICPSRIDRKKVESTKRALGVHNTAAQFDQNPQQAEGGYIKREWFAGRIVACLPEDGKVKRQHRHWDLAATEGGGDWTVGLKMDTVKVKGEEDIRYYITSVVRGQWGPFRRDEQIKATAQADSSACTQSVEQEPGSGGKTQATAIVKMLREKRLRASVYPSPRKGKFLAADAFVAACERGQVYLIDGPWATTLLDELCSLQRDIDGQVDDQLDGCSGCFNMITGRAKFVAAVG